MEPCHEAGFGFGNRGELFFKALYNVGLIELALGK
ncbi:hypothetical protein HDN1F_06950 [gamma proteobacterium HdN1]|nr:hypothetical protein HDN1F_06950 [gamma proteobacterium HdN1]